MIAVMRTPSMETGQEERHAGRAVGIPWQQAMAPTPTEQQRRVGWGVAVWGVENGDVRQKSNPKFTYRVSKKVSNHRFYDLFYFCREFSKRCLNRKTRSVPSWTSLAIWRSKSVGPGSDLRPDVKPENIRAIVDTVHDYGKKPSPAMGRMV